MNDEVQAEVVAALNNAAQAAAENQHTKTQEVKDYSEVEKQIDYALDHLKHAKRELQNE